MAANRLRRRGGELSDSEAATPVVYLSATFVASDTDVFTARNVSFDSGYHRFITGDTFYNSAGTPFTAFT